MCRIMQLNPVNNILISEEQRGEEEEKLALLTGPRSGPWAEAPITHQRLCNPPGRFQRHFTPDDRGELSALAEIAPRQRVARRRHCSAGAKGLGGSAFLFCAVSHPAPASLSVRSESNSNAPSFSKQSCAPPAEVGWLPDPTHNMPTPQRRSSLLPRTGPLPTYLRPSSLRAHVLRRNRGTLAPLVNFKTVVLYY